MSKAHMFPVAAYAHLRPQAPLRHEDRIPPPLRQTRTGGDELRNQHTHVIPHPRGTERDPLPSEGCGSVRCHPPEAGNLCGGGGYRPKNKESTTSHPTLCTFYTTRNGDEIDRHSLQSFSLFVLFRGLDDKSHDVDFFGTYFVVNCYVSSR